MQPERIAIRQDRSKPPIGKVGKLLQTLERIQVYCARGADLETVWWVCEKAIEANTRGH